ncbi:MAG TPA: efflux RND transporter periplasmic adaptor subunit [Thermoanaerobaculia bacterium]|nr:efflux RND transporter periplasmic adaptor subunit [Thermoanaerobaculia bacterium]
MRRLAKILIILVVLAGVSAALYAWARSSRNDEQGLKEVEVATGSITEKAVAVGQVEPRQKFQVKSKISGIVRQTLVEVGDTVRPGDALFEIAPDPTPMELTDVDRRVQSAQASFERAKSEYDRAIELAQSGVLPRSDLDGRRESFELAKIALARAQEERQLTRMGKLTAGGTESTIRASAPGTILTRLVDVGYPVVPLTSYQPGTELATIAMMDDLIFRGTVDEIDVGKLRVGLPARIKIGALPNTEVHGIVTRIAPQAQQEEGATLFDVEIELSQDLDVPLRAGYSANADIIIREKNDILTVPERLVAWENEGKNAFVEIPGPTPEAEPKRVEIETGISDGLNIEVVSGLQKGQKVIERPPKEIS